MPGSMLRLLQDGLCTQGLNYRPDLLRLMTDDDNRLLRAQRHASSHDVLDERPPPGAVQYLREARFQTCAFARSENDHS